MACQADLWYNRGNNVLWLSDVASILSRDDMDWSHTMSISIPLPHGKFTLISDEDSDLAQYNWCQTAGDYVVRKRPGVRGAAHIRLHRVILERMLGRELAKGEYVDMDKLNNQRENLRLATSSQNHYNTGKHVQNTSGYKGVSFHKAMEKWVAQIQYKGQRRVIGFFDTPESAAKAYNDKATELHGKFAKINDLPEGIAAEPAKPRLLFRNNKSGYRGVHFLNRDQKWLATLYIHGKQTCVGRFDNPLDAAKAYNQSATKYYGDKAKLNDLGENTP